MSTPFVETSKPIILQSLEAECAARYGVLRDELEQLIRENERLKARMAVARDRLRELTQQPIPSVLTIRAIREDLK